MIFCTFIILGQYKNIFYIIEVNKMSRKSQSLQHLAYKAIPDSTRRKIRSEQSRYAEQSVMERVRADFIKEKKQSMIKWVSSAKIPIKIQGILILANHFTKPDFYNAAKNLRAIQWYNNKKKPFGNYGDYFDDFVLYINEKELSYLGDDHYYDNLKKWHFLIGKTFYLLCYKRLNHIFKLHEYFDEDDGYFSKEFMDVIFGLEESDILPLIIYKLLDKNYDIEALKY